MAHPNEDLLRRGYEAFSSGDMQTLGELFAVDIVWHVGGRNQLSSDYRGTQEVFNLFGSFAQLTGGTLRIELHDVLANDEHAVALQKVTGEREGRTLDDNGVGVYHVREGKVTEAWFHPGDAYDLDEFWG
jgi:ketosteroid isomerase-like protein